MEEPKRMDPERLQRYFDGELDAEERRRVEAELTDEDRARLAALEELSALVGGTLGAEAAEVDLWRGVEAGIKKARVRRWRERVGSRARRTTAGAGILVAALATLLFIFKPWHPAHPENDCDVESLEVDGAMATVISVHGAPHASDGPTTVIWTEED
jgi:anti-sigma factor RsiW